MERELRIEQPEHKKFTWLHNLEMLDSEMQRVLNRESIGGNAGKSTVDGIKYVCAAANGYADPETGEIKAFGNFQDLSTEQMSNSREFTMRVAFDKKRGFFNIVEILNLELFEPRARSVLEEAAAKYNIKHRQEEAA